MEKARIQEKKIAGRHSYARRLLESLGKDLDCSKANISFSPMYSDLGLGFSGEPGIASLFLHYNRRTTSLGKPFLSWPIPKGSALETESAPLHVRQSWRSGYAEFAFYDRNSWLMECQGVEALEFQFPSDNTLSAYRMDNDPKAGIIVFDAFLPNKDPRDPDKTFPFVLGLRILKGEVNPNTGPDAPMRIRATPDGAILLAFSANSLRVSHAEIRSLLLRAPGNTEQARKLTFSWLEEALGEFDLPPVPSAEERVLAMAVHTLLSNACIAPGLLEGRIASFPSRGGYPTHFLWDTCFHNLALENMHPRLAEDALLLLTDNLRTDGKMAHFICSTWIRPHESQPALVGWAALRLLQNKPNRSLALSLLGPLWKNTQWWLEQRMTRFGILSCPDPLETGWDDTPRLDKGPILACDMNSYVLMQMNACASIADMCGDTKSALEYRSVADSFSHKMMEVLYDSEANLFRDVLAPSGEKLAIKTPASFLPLLAGVPLAENKARAMIETYLLDPTLFFGPVPFPCVAYNEESYQPEQWWRGPTWLPIAYFMLEILGKFGYTEERRQAGQRLYDVIWKDGDIHELFNSKTGEGMGNKQQGWTAAILLKLRLELDEAE